ncbi:hypothetical protein BRD18_04255 [Halobacteriales archaeon SW_7_71_33]|nr:MAG: hypothetical protein BRD18_04255 [Halobacteriales archaeon SW_7_71_33]
MTRPGVRHGDDHNRDEETRADRRERYEAVLGTARGSTSQAHSYPGCRPVTIIQGLVAHGSYDADAVRASIQAAVENWDLIRWRDEYADRRVTPTDPEEDERRLRELAEHAAEHLLDPELVAQANRALHGGDESE